MSTATLTAPKPAYGEFVIYKVRSKYFMKSKIPGSQEREISPQEYEQLLEIKNNDHKKLNKSIS